MKNLLKINLMAVLMLAVCTLVTAQDKQQHMNRLNKHRGHNRRNHESQ